MIKGTVEMIKAKVKSSTIVFPDTGALTVNYVEKIVEMDEGQEVYVIPADKVTELYAEHYVETSDIAVLIDRLRGKKVKVLIVECEG